MLGACGNGESAAPPQTAQAPPPVFSSGVPAARRAQEVPAVPTQPVSQSALSGRVPPAPPPSQAAPSRPVAPPPSPVAAPQPAPAVQAAPAAASSQPATAVTPADLASEGRAIGEKVTRGWTPPPNVAEVIDAVIEVRVAVDTDGTVLAVRTVDETRMARDPRYKQWAESLEDAIVRATPLPIPAGRYEQYKLMILPFNPRLVFGNRLTPAAEIRAVQEHVAKFWYPPQLSRGMRGQDFAVTVYVTVDADGTVKEARTVNQTRMVQDPLYRQLADSAERAVKEGSPLPVSREGPPRQRVLVLNFVPDDE